MPRCEDYPCCGHEEGGCPDSDGAFFCAVCSRKMPKNWASAVCSRCHGDWRRQRQEEANYNEFGTGND
jgi:hypothetical protein